MPKPVENQVDFSVRCVIVIAKSYSLYNDHYFRGSSAMASRRNLVERRKYNRFSAKDSVAAALRSHLSKKVGLVMNVSRGGLAFRYIDSAEKVSEPLELDIMLGDISISLKDVPVEFVTDGVMQDEYSFSLIPLRKCSVRFADMNEDTATRLDFLLQHHIR